MIGKYIIKMNYWKKKTKKTKNVNKYKEEKENEIINEELFDENGKIIFTHVKLSDIDQNM